MTLLFSAGLLQIPGLGLRFQPPGDPPPAHENPRAGFRITPPPGWTERVDDQDGSRIAPPFSADRGMSWIVVSTRLTPNPDPKRYLQELTEKPATGPVAELRWGEVERVHLDAGMEGAWVELSQTWQGRPVKGWLLATVDAARLLQVSAVLPADRSPQEFEALRAALLTIAPL
jgi:hypothetical protein